MLISLIKCCTLLDQTTRWNNKKFFLLTAFHTVFISLVSNEHSFILRNTGHSTAQHFIPSILRSLPPPTTIMAIPPSFRAYITSHSPSPISQNSNYLKKMNARKNFFFLLLLLLAAHSLHIPLRAAMQPCKTLSFFFHDIIYNGENRHNATAAIVAAPAWGNHTTLAPHMHFGNIVVFDDPITLDNNLRSPHIGRAQGLYLYDRKDVFTAWLAFSLVFNTTGRRGIINLAGADLLMNKTRDVSVVGGTGDFFMARGVATLTTDAFEDEVYFRLRVDLKLYECYA